MAKQKKAAGELQLWPADQSERIPLKSLVPYARNARRHSAEQILQIRASMREFGWTMAILRDEKGGVIAGHGRLLAAQAEVEAGDKRFLTVPCMTARGWSEAKKRAYVIADNKLTLNATWDDELLKTELLALQEDGYDLGLTGFSTDEISMHLNGWESTIDPLSEHGENLDGIERKISVSVAQDDEEKARDAIGKALKKAGIEYELA